MPKLSPEVSAYFAELANQKNKKLSKKARRAAARRAGLAAWSKMSPRQRSLELKRRARVRKRNRVERMKEDELLRERIAKRKAGLDE